MALVFVPHLLELESPQRKPARHSRPLDLARNTLKAWAKDKCVKLAAALACYSILSLAPLVVILFKLISVVLRDERAHDLIARNLQNLMGGVANTELIDAILKASHNRSGALATTISIVMLLFGASGVFGELQDSLNTIWKVKPKKAGGILHWLRNRFVSMSMVLGLGF